jgi:hypothetical protein
VRPLWKIIVRFCLGFGLLLVLIISTESRFAEAASLSLNWADNSSNETGFTIERKTGTNGTFAQITTVGANVRSYIDSTLANSTTYCYRVRAYNSSANSAYSNEMCGTTTAPVFNLTLTRSGTGSGTVTSSPSGINCGTTCAANYNSGQMVALSAVPASGSTFAGWSGNADCSDGSVTMNANIACTATFNALPQYTLTISKSGTGSGTVTSSPNGLNCGAICSVNFVSNQVVSLFAAPATGSSFAGWSGNADCADGFVTMNASKSCTATFNTSTSNTVIKSIEDVNGDRKSDLILRGTNNTFWVAQSTGSGFTAPVLWLQHGGQYAEGQAQYVDLNGDGKTDLIYQGVDNNFWASLSTGTSFTPPALWMDHGGTFLQGQAQYVDLNGDGKADLIMQGVDNNFWVSLSTGTNFTPPTLWMIHGGTFLRGEAQYADLNGDGKADMIMQGLDNNFWVSLSTGINFTPPTLWMDHGGTFLAGQAQYADLNGDGKADMIMQGLDNNFWVSLSTGINFTPPTLWLDHGGTFQEGQAEYLDVNGDGKMDIVFHGADNKVWVSLSTGTSFTAPQPWLQF